MRDTLPQYPFNIECGIVNLNTSDQSGSQEIQRYLKTGIEFKSLSCEYVSVWSSLFIRIEIINKR